MYDLGTVSNDFIPFIYDLDTIVLTLAVDFKYGCIYGLTRFVWSCTVAYMIIPGPGIRANFKSFNKHTRLTQINWYDPSVTRIMARLFCLYVRFTWVVNRIRRVFCVRRTVCSV
jgi:hypothetical protein